MGEPAKTTIIDDPAELDASIEKLETLEIKSLTRARQAISDGAVHVKQPITRYSREMDAFK
jgi:hypothetical protein